MKTLGRPLLTALVAGALGNSLPAQQNPGLSALPTGRTLEEPDAAPIGKPVDFSRRVPAAVSFEVNTKKEDFFAPAMRGEAWAQRKLGKIYMTTSDDPLPLQQGILLLRQAAEQNDAEALLELSSLAALGRGMAQSDWEAFDYCRRAANTGLDQAQHRLALMHASGTGTAQDSDAAISWFRKAALQGYPPAKHALALALLESQQPGDSSAEAIVWLESAAKDGHREALFFLAGAIAHGDYGLEKDERKAAAMALPRAEAGDPEFQFALATLYLKGESFAERRAEGQKWLEKAAASGQQDAQRMLEE